MYHLTRFGRDARLTGGLFSAIGPFRLFVRRFIGGEKEKEGGSSRNRGRITPGGLNVDSKPFPLGCGGDIVADSGQVCLALVKEIPTKI